MPSRLNYTLLDYSGERTGFGLYGATLSAANFATQVALASGVQAALDDITLGVIAKEVLIASEDQISSTPPTSPYAQRELKLLFTYADDVTGELYTFTVPMPDLSALTPVGGTDVIDLEDAGVGAAFVSAVESFARSKDGNAITIQSARIVGRNL